MRMSKFCAKQERQVNRMGTVEVTILFVVIVALIGGIIFFMKKKGDQ